MRERSSLLLVSDQNILIRFVTAVAGQKHLNLLMHQQGNDVSVQRVVGLKTGIPAPLRYKNREHFYW